MQSLRFMVVALFASALAIAAPVAAAQRDSVTRDDIQRLQSDINRTARDIADLRSQDPSLATRLDRELNDLSDEAIYFKVKVTKGETVSRREYEDVRSRLTDLSSRATGDVRGGIRTGTTPDRSRDDRNPDDRTGPSAQGTSGVYSDTPGVVPAGVEFDVRLENELSSATAQPEDRFTATTVVDLRQGDRVLVPAGSIMRGVVRTVHKATRMERSGSLTVMFDRLTINRTSYPIRATVTDALQSEGIRGEAGKIGAGAGIGAIIGGIIGGAKGALAGILIGAGGTVAATEGSDVVLQPGTVLRVRLDSALDVR